MTTVKSYLTAAFFTLAGVAVHANASTKKLDCDNRVCFQLTPLADNNASTLKQV